MEKNRISAFQLFSLMTLFQLGTALVVNLGLEARRDAWIAVFLGMGYGLLLFWMLVYLYKLFPDMLPTEYVRILFGKYIGTVIGVMYVVFFTYVTGRDLRDGGALVLSLTLKQTPLVIANTLMIMSVAYVLHKGVEVLARTALIFLAMVMLIGAFSTVLLVLSDVIEPKRLLPILENGIQPILSTFVHQSYAFPFSEVICFAMLLPYLSKSKNGIRAGYLSILLAGVLLSYTSAMNISVLGVNMVERSPLPLMTTVSKTSISDFIQRNDIFIVMTLIIGDFFKVAVYYYAAVIGAAEIFKLEYRKLVYPVGLLVLVISLLVASSLPEHLEEGAKVLYQVSPLFFVVIPVILVIAGWIYKKRSASKSGSS